MSVWRLEFAPLLQKSGISIEIAAIWSNFASCLDSMLHCFLHWFFEFAIWSSFILLVGFISVSYLLVQHHLLTTFYFLYPWLLLIVEVENKVKDRFIFAIFTNEFVYWLILADLRCLLICLLFIGWRAYWYRCWLFIGRFRAIMTWMLSVDIFLEWALVIWFLGYPGCVGCAILRIGRIIPVRFGMVLPTRAILWFSTCLLCSVFIRFFMHI